MVFRVLANPLLRQHGFDDLLHDAFAQVAHFDVRVVLRGEDDSVDGDGLVVLVNEGHLALGVRAQEGQRAAPANFGLAPDQAMGKRDRRRHQDVGLVRCVAEHEALVARALAFGIAAVHALGDIG